MTDLEASAAWYARVLGVEPVIDEETGPFRHIDLLGPKTYREWWRTECFRRPEAGATGSERLAATSARA